MKKTILAIITGYLLIYIVPLGLRPLHMPDEMRYAEIPREMAESGDWVVPHLDAIRYFEKPVLGYWLTAASIKLFGENAFAVRFPSALAAGISALMLFLMVWFFGGGTLQAIVSTAAFLSCLEVFGLGVFNVLDGVLSMFLTIALTAFFFAADAKTRMKRTIFLGIFGAFCGFAFLTKGFLAFLIPVAVIVPFLLWQNRWKDLFIIPWIPLIVAVVVALPWSIAIHLRESDFWHYFFWEEHVARFTSDTAQHKEPFWYYLPVILGGAIPWILMLPASISGLVRTRFREPLVRYAVCWLFFPLVFFSMSRGKLGTYILPLFVPLMILVAIGIWQYLEGPGRRLFKFGAVSSILLAVILAGVVLFVPLSRIKNLSFSPYITVSKYMLAASLVLWIVLMVKALKQQRPVRKLAFCCLAPCLFFFLAHVSTSLVNINEHMPEKFFEEYAGQIGPGTTIASGSYTVSAVCWFYKRNDVFIFEKRGELDYGLEYEDTKQRFLTFDKFKNMVKKEKRVEPIVLFLSYRKYKRFVEHLPKPLNIYRDSGFVLLRY